MSNAGSPPPLAGPSGVGLKRKRVAGKAPGDAKKRRKDLIGVGSPASDGGTPGDYGSPAHAYSPGGVGTPGATPAPGTVRPEDDPAAGAADDDDDEPLLPPATYGTEYDKLAKEAQENQRKLVAAFGPDQTDRYDAWRQANFKKGSIKRLVNAVLQQSVTEQIVVGVRSFSKVFVGEIIEEARRVQSQRGEAGPLQPDHLHEAYRRWRASDEPSTHTKRKFVR